MGAGEVRNEPSLEECRYWLDQLDEGATIWDSELKFIDRIKAILDLLIDNPEDMR
jgi:hypothetical protein